MKIIHFEVKIHLVTYIKLQGYFNSLRSEKVGTGIKITILCPGPVFSDLLRSASTENAGEVSNLLNEIIVSIKKIILISYPFSI